MATRNANAVNYRRSAGQARYSGGAIILHWLLVLAMAFQIAIGFAMPHHGPHSFVPMQLHKSVGITILLTLTVWAGGSSVGRPRPSNRAGLRWPPGSCTGVLRRAGARAGHWLDYRLNRAPSPADRAVRRVAMAAPADVPNAEPADGGDS